jgi:ketosteroid isomerase-like protein
MGVRIIGGGMRIAESARFGQDTAMKQIIPLVFSVLVVMCSAAGPAFAAKVPADLAKAVADYDAAQIKGDGAALKRLLADDYTLVNSAGAIENKDQLIADYTAPGYKLDPFVVREPIEKIWSDGAVMGGVAKLSGTDGGKRFEATLRFADIWAKRQGVWQVIYTHVSKAVVPEASHP